MPVRDNKHSSELPFLFRYSGAASFLAMNVPINDLQRVFRSNEAALTDAVQSVLATGWWLNGRQHELFCKEFAGYVGTSKCIGVANGTDALEIAMRTLIDVRELDRTEVVTVPNAGGYSTIACRVLGLVPVYADIDEQTQLADLDSVLSCVGDNTAFVLATHLYGGAIDVGRLRQMLDTNGYTAIPILEDCAQAHGARSNGTVVGGLGDIAAFSFYPTKNLGALGDAGAILTSGEDLAQAAMSLRQYGWEEKYRVVSSGGRNSRMDEIQAAALRVLLPRLNDNNAKRRRVLKAYIEAAPKGVTVVDAGEGSVAHLAVLLCEDRDSLRAYLGSRGVGTDVHYPILDCDQEAWQSLPYKIAPSGVPVARRCVDQILTIPCFPEMTDAELDQVCDALSSWQK